MGYRSKVVIALSEEIRTKLLIKVLDLPKLLKENDPTEESENLFWVFDDVKWYSDYPQIIEVMHFLKTLDNSDYSLEGSAKFCYCRIGEDPGDVEELGSPWKFNVEIVQDISIPFSY